MIRVEVAEKVMEQLGYSRSIIHRAIQVGELETVVDESRVFSDYGYAIMSRSFYGYLYKLGVSERQICSIMDNI